MAQKQKIMAMRLTDMLQKEETVLAPLVMRTTTFCLNLNVVRIQLPLGMSIQRMHHQ